MRHLPEGVLRRLLDEPAGVAEDDRRHVTDCAHCAAALSAVREDASVVSAALGTPAQVDVAAAWSRLRASTDQGARALPVPRPREGAALLRRPAVAAVAVALVISGASAAAAADWLQVFRTEKVVPVSVTASDLVALPDLSDYGRLTVTREASLRSVPDAAAAANATGLVVPVVSALPRGVTGVPVYQVGSKASATFTFSAEQARRAAAAAGQQLPPVPPGLDGARVRLDAGPGLAAVWAQSSGRPAMVVARAVAPTAFSSGIPFPVVRDYLLSLPGLSPQVAAQLRAFAGDGSTLPLPVPADQVTSSQATVGEAPATLLVTRDRALSAVVWVRAGVVTVVAGSLDDGEVLSVARALP